MPLLLLKKLKNNKYKVATKYLSIILKYVNKSLNEKVIGIRYPYCWSDKEENVTKKLETVMWQWIKFRNLMHLYNMLWKHILHPNIYTIYKKGILINFMKCIDKWIVILNVWLKLMFCYKLERKENKVKKSINLYLFYWESMPRIYNVQNES